MYLFGKHYEEHSLIKLVIIALSFAVVVFGILFMTSGCASGSLVDNQLLKVANKGDVQAVKTGDIAPIKAPINAKASITGQSNDITTSQGANSKIININSNEMIERYITLMKYVIYGLLGVITALCGLIATLITGIIGALMYLLKTDRLEDMLKSKKEGL